MSNIAKPDMTISVVVPAYNSEQFLDTALASILGQIRPADEVIVVNDCSTDNTLEIARQWEDRLPLVIIDKPVNGGLGAARKSAGEIATGDLIALLDSDDVWFPDHLGLMESLVRDHHTIVTPSTLRWYPSDKIGSNGSTELFPIPKEEKQLLNLLDWNFMFSGCMFDRETYLAVGGFSNRRKNEDWELWIRMLSSGCTVVGAPTPTVLYRQHSQSLSSADGCLDDDIEMFEELLKTRRGKEKTILDRALRRRYSRRTMLSAFESYEQGHSFQARRLFLRAARMDRSFRGGRSSLSGSIALRGMVGAVIPGWAARHRLFRNTNPNAIKSGLWPKS